MCPAHMPKQIRHPVGFYLDKRDRLTRDHDFKTIVR
jgi:hypothetical protein